MIHRAILGSLERFLGILIEHYAGNFPLWLAPEQVRVMPISEKTNDYALQVCKRLKQSGIRATADLTNDKIGAKIARGHAEKIPYMLVAGPAEVSSGSVSVRIRQANDSRTVPMEQFLSSAIAKIADKSPDLGLKSV
jgi:threonyl-tRNA synthetase